MKKAPRLFSPEKGGHGNVVLNFIGSPRNEMAAMAESYFRAATTLREKFERRSGYNDLVGCPIVFLYRHSLELFLKAICDYGNTLAALLEEPELSTPDVFKDHSLTRHLKTLKAIFTAVGWEEDFPKMGLDDPVFEDVIREFDKVDNGSFAFRYPVKKDGKTASVSDNFAFNIPKFGVVIESILKNLSGACIGLDEYCDLAHEIHAEAAADMYSDYEADMYSDYLADMHDNYDPGDYYG
jgi:hypothetical protein